MVLTSLLRALLPEQRHTEQSLQCSLATLGKNLIDFAAFPQHLHLRRVNLPGKNFKSHAKASLYLIT